MAATPALRTLRLGPLALPGYWQGPGDAPRLVLFAHGSGSGAGSPRNRYVAEQLAARGMATLRMDLLTPTEAADRRKVFDIELLGARLLDAIDAIDALQPAAGAARHIGLFGASTGAAAALLAAAERPDRIEAVVSRGGRGDLAAEALPRVRSRTLLIVGGDDTEVLQLNRAVLAALRCTKRLAVVPGAGHLFEEPGALEAVAQLAADWFNADASAGCTS